MTPLRPRGDEWLSLPVPEGLPVDRDAEGWLHPDKGILVLSVVDPSGTAGELEYHISISTQRGPCTTEEAMETLNTFGMDNAEESNPGNILVRHFWQPIPQETKL